MLKEVVTEEKTPQSPGQMNNSLRVIMPYKWNGLWVFDDASVGLEKEALVCGIDTMLDMLTEGIPNRNRGVLCVFSDQPFPTANVHLRWRRADAQGSGNWYHCQLFDSEGWLCPALLRYFKKAPRNIYAQITAKPKKQIRKTV